MAFSTAKNHKKFYHCGIVFLMLFIFSSPNFVVAQTSTSLPQNFARTIFCGINNLLGIKSCKQSVVAPASDQLAGVSFIPSGDEARPQIIQHITQPVIERSIHTKEIIKQVLPEKTLAQFALQLDQLNRTLYQPSISAYDDTDLWRAIALMNVSGASSSANTDNQSLSFDNGTSVLTISGGNAVDLSALSGGGGSDDQTLTAATYNASSKQLSISIENGNTVTIDLSALIDDADADATNEIQTLSLSGDSLSISATSTAIDLSAYLDDTTLTELQVDTFISDNGYLTSEVDGSVLNEIQDLQLSGNNLIITGNGTATTIDLSPYLDNTDTLSDLNCASNEIAKWNGSAWGCSADASGAGGTDDQTIDSFGLSANIISLSLEGDGEAVKTIDLTAYVNTDTQLNEAQVDSFVSDNGYLTSETDGSITNEIQALALSSNILSLSGTSSPIDLSIYLDDTDTTYSAGTGLLLTGTSFSSVLGSSIDISDETNLTGNAEIVLTGDNLTIASSLARDAELHDAVTLTTSSTTSTNYLSITGQIITQYMIDLANNVAGVLGIVNGGTNATTASGARTNLGLAIGSDIQAYNANTTQIGQTIETGEITDGTITAADLADTYLTSYTETDGSITNEIQGLSLSSDILAISGAATPIDLSIYLDDTDTQLSQAQVGTYATNEGFIKTDTNTTYTAGTGLTLTGTTFSSDLGTSIDNTEITDGTILDNDLNLTDITISDFNNDANYLSTIDISSNSNLTVSAAGLELNGDAIALSAGFNIPLTASTTEWSTTFGWGDHSLQGYLTSETDGSISNEIQGLSVSSNILSLSGTSTPIDLSVYLDDTDTQLNETEVDNYVANNGYLTVATDDQTIDAFGLVGDSLSLSLEGDGEAVKTVDLSSYAKDTDLHDAITLSGTLDYLTLVGQDIVGGAIDLASDITGTLSVGNGGTGATTTVLARSNLGLAIGANVQAFDSDTSLIGQTIETTEITNGTILGADLNLTDITLSDFTNDQSYITDGNSNWDNSYGFLTSANDSVSGSELDGVFSASGLLTRTGAGTYSTLDDNSANWNTAFSWGNHASGGYLTGITGQSIKTLSDVYGSMTPTNGQVLTYDTTNGWQSETLPDGADHLGNHTATQTLNLNGNWLSGDGDAEGLFIDGSGKVGIGTSNPTEKLTIDGNLAFVGAAKNIIVNNTSAAWTIATSTSSTPLFKIDTTSGSELVTLGKSGGSVIIGDVGSATNLVFEESAIIHGQGDNTLTFGQAGDKINFAVNVGIGTANPTHPLHMGSGAHVTAGGSWTNASSRDLKENFVTLNPVDILTSINALDISQWNYKAEDSSVLHIGPIAQDFFTEFGLGGSDLSISTIDTAGVALIGIQALSHRFDDLFAGFSITENGTLIVSDIETEKIKAKTICLGSTCITETALRDLLDLEPLSEVSNLQNDPAENTEPVEEIIEADEEEASEVTATSTAALLEQPDPIEQATSTDEPSLDEQDQLSDNTTDDIPVEPLEDIPIEPASDEQQQDVQPPDAEPELIEPAEPDISSETEVEQAQK